MSLKKTDTREPISPVDLVKLETGKDQVEEEIQTEEQFMEAMAQATAASRRQDERRQEGLCRSVPVI